MSIAPGTMLDQRYRVVSLLGQGGMGAVYLAEHGVLGHAVAIKVVNGNPGAKNDVVIRRALQEARIAAMLRSPHVVRVSDVFQVQGQGLAIVMERLRGRDLDQMVDSHGLPEPMLAVEWMLEACAGLAEAHAAGLVHRDIKLSNIFLADMPEGTSQIKLLDFGIARLHGAEGAKMTQTEDVFGSPYFMAPEQVRSATLATAQSDVWSLGVCLYHLLSGRYPFEGDSPSGVLVAIATEEPTPLLAHAPQIHAPLAGVVMRCLVRDLSRRCRGVLELAQALGALAPTRFEASVRRVAAACVEVDSVRTGLSGSHLAAPSEPSMASGVGRSHLPSSAGTLEALTVATARVSAPAGEQRPRRVWIVGGGAVAALVAGVGLWLGLHGAETPTISESAKPTHDAHIKEAVAPSVVTLPRVVPLQPQVAPTAPLETSTPASGPSKRAVAPSSKTTAPPRTRSPVAPSKRGTNDM